MQSIDFENIKDWKNIDSNEEVLWAKSEQYKVTEAKMLEIDNWKKHNVYTEVPNDGERHITVRWVITEKVKEGVTVVKARLVARGFEEQEMEVIRKDSPTCCRENLRIILTIISSKSWKVNTLDIKSAFLQGKQIDREVYIKPPVEAGTENLWKLQKTVYGLCDAPRAWYLSIKEEIVKTGCKKSKFDDAIFFFFWMSG